MYHIVVAQFAVHFEGFRHGLRELGYIEGKNIAGRVPICGGKLGSAPWLAAEMVRLKVDVIVISSSRIRAAKNATKTIPIVFAGVSRSSRDGAG